MSDALIRSTDDDEVIEANILEARENNEYERTLTIEAPGGPPPIHATDVPRDNENRERDVTPIGYSSSRTERRLEAEREALLGPYVGPIDGEGVTEEEVEEARVTGPTGGRYDSEGNLLHDPGILPGHDPRGVLGGTRDEDGNLIADHDGDGKAAADEGPIREAIGAGVSPKEDEEDQHGSRSLQDEERDLDDEAEASLAPEHDPDASEEEQKGGRGQDDRDLGENEESGQYPEHSEFLDDADVSPQAAATPSVPQPIDVSVPVPGEDAPASEWRDYATATGVHVEPTWNKARTKSALRDAGRIQ